jgi:hypothetical protein
MQLIAQAKNSIGETTALDEAKQDLQWFAAELRERNSGEARYKRAKAEKHPCIGSEQRSTLCAAAGRSGMEFWLKDMDERIEREMSMDEAIYVIVMLYKLN